MNYWLLKTEPSVYCYGDLEREGKTVWDGVSNNLALKYIRQVKAGDQALIYHTGNERAITGIAEVVTDAYGDANDPKLAVFEVIPRGALPHPVTLATIKSDPRFSGSLLVKNARLSVMPITPEEWHGFLQLGQVSS